MRARVLPLTTDAGNVRRAAAPAGDRAARPMRGLPRRHFRRGQPAGLAEADDQRRRQRAGAQAALLAAAGEQRRQPHARPAADVQRADPLRAIDLVAADRREIDLPAGQVERDLAHRLGDVGVEQRAGLLGDRGERGNVLHHARLVVHRHDADQQRRHRRAPRAARRDPAARRGGPAGTPARSLPPPGRRPIPGRICARSPR